MSFNHTPLHCARQQKRWENINSLFKGQEKTAYNFFLYLFCALPMNIQTLTLYSNEYAIPPPPQYFEEIYTNIKES